MHISNEGQYPTESGALIRTKGSPEKKKQQKKWMRFSFRARFKIYLQNDKDGEMHSQWKQ